MATKKAEATETKKAEKKETIGSVAIAALKAGNSPQEALDAVLAKFPDAQTKMASIYWYASKEGIDLAARRRATPREAKPATKVVKAGAAAKAAKATSKTPAPAAKKKVGPLTTVGKGKTTQAGEVVQDVAKAS